VRSTRRDLAELDDDLLRDIGVSPLQAQRELKKSIYLLDGGSRLLTRSNSLPKHDLR
jgi:Domain of unknown function (DUF1127)